MRKTLLSIAGFAALVLAMRTLPVDPSPATRRVQRTLMGTIWTIEVAHGANAAQAIDQAFAELERIDRLMSEWKPESPLSAVNRAAGEGMVEVPEELRALIGRSVKFSERSGGAFDITWHGMRHIWHFDENFAVPDRAAVERARALVNFRDIGMDGSRVGLARRGMSIGLGGIAKGYAIDRAAGVLKAAGLSGYLVDGGGDVLVSGHKNGGPWRLGIQDPRSARGTLLGSMTMTQGVLVTSGDNERFRMANGVRYHHIIDPRTGWPASGCRSVTVLADSAERAVVLAKVIFIAGAAKGIRIARDEKVEALIIDSDGQRHWTTGMREAFETI